MTEQTGTPGSPDGGGPRDMPTGTLPRAAVTPPHQVTGASVAPPRGPRRARVMLRTIDPWSVFRFSLVFSLSLLIVWVVVAAVLYSVLERMGILTSVLDFVNQITEEEERTVDDVLPYGRVLMWATALGAVNAILLTALATLGAFVYNLCSRIVGGLEVTLSDRN